MPRAGIPIVLGAIVVGALVASAMSGTSAAGRTVQARTRTVFVSANDRNGDPVTDLKAGDVEIKVGGKAQEIVSVEPATAPLRIALLVADQGTGAFQLGIARFMQRLLGRAEFSLVSVVVQPEQVVDYSPDAAALSAGLDRLGRRGRQLGGQLMEALQEATKDVRRESRRPVIVVTRIGREAQSDISGSDLREQLRKSGAILYVVSTIGADRRAPPQARGTDAVSVQQGQLRDQELADSASNLAQVLGDGADESGGRHEQVGSTSLVKALEDIAGELLHQQQISYIPTDSVKAGDKLSVSPKRKGVKVRAPARLPS